MAEKTVYLPNDPDLPLVLRDRVFKSEIFEPVSVLVDYVNALFREGYGADTLRRDLVDMYALDFYISQVDNGGHSQFIHNSFQHLHTNMERAARAARMIGVPELADLVESCAAFCRDNPDEASRQDGFGNRAEDLEGLDKALYALNYTAEERAAFLDTLPPGHGDDLRDKFHLIGAEETVAAVVAEVERLLPDLTNEGAAKRAAALARGFYDHKLSKTHGAEPSDYKTRGIDSEVDYLSTYILVAIRDTTPEERPATVADTARKKLLKEGSSDLSKYQLHAAAWIAQHPNLKLVPRETWREEVAALAAASPFAVLEKQRRARDTLAKAMPTDDMVALAAAMADVWETGNNELFFRFTEGKPQSSSGYTEIHLAKTTGDPIFLCKGAGAVAVRAVAPNPWYKPLSNGGFLLRRLKLLSVTRGLDLLAKVPKQRPGPVLGQAAVETGMAQMFHDLHVPEALMQWDDNPELRHYFHRGVLVSRSPLVWHYHVEFLNAEDENTVMTADADGVHFLNRTTGHEARFAAVDLAALRARLDA